MKIPGNAAIMCVYVMLTYLCTFTQSRFQGMQPLLLYMQSLLVSVSYNVHLPVNIEYHVIVCDSNHSIYSKVNATFLYNALLLNTLPLYKICYSSVVIYLCAFTYPSPPPLSS